MPLEAIRYSCGKLEVLDQLLLPHQSRYISVPDTDHGWRVIHDMQVRGAPAIAIVGCLSLAVELAAAPFADCDQLVAHVQRRLRHLVTARPTAVNLQKAAHALTQLAETAATQTDDVTQLKNRVIAAAEAMLEDDVKDNRAIGRHGAEHILRTAGKGGAAGDKEGATVGVLTHCNTGALATAGYGTALGVIRALHEQRRLERAFCTETRPYNQGSRLTSYELVQEEMPATLVCDSAAAALLRSGRVHAVVVGADRVARNGDTANKIGTYQLAIAAAHHAVPFYVAAPCTSIDPTLASGDLIPIEERPASELLQVAGVRVAADGIEVWNPAFDVTPADLITGGIITEKGVVPAPDVARVLT